MILKSAQINCPHPRDVLLHRPLDIDITINHLIYETLYPVVCRLFRVWDTDTTGRHFGNIDLIFHD